MQARAQVQVRALVLAYLAWIRAVVAAAAVAVLGSNQVPQPRIHEYSCIHVVFTRGWNTCINTCVQSGGGCVQHVGLERRSLPNAGVSARGLNATATALESPTIGGVAARGTPTNRHTE